MMRNRLFVLFAILILPMFLRGQDCLFAVKIRGGDTVRINSVNLKYMSESTASATIIIYGDVRTAYVVDEPIGDIVGRTNGSVVLFTDDKTGKQIGISRTFLLEAREAPDSKVFFIAVDARFRWKSAESLTSLIPALEVCASGGGGLLYSGSNVGTGTGQIFKQTNGATHEFREIVGDDVISVTTNGDNVALTTNAMDTIETTAEFNGPITNGSTLQLKDNSVSGYRLTQGTVNGAKLEDDAVSYDKMQNMTGLRLLGKPTSGVGDVSEISLGAGLQFNGASIEATATAGVTPYDAGSDAYVKASASGITFSKASGVGTLTIPSGVTPSYIRINGDNTELAGDGSFTIVMDYDVSVSWNQGLPTYMPPMISVINTAGQAGGGPNTSYPFIYDEGSTPVRKIVGVAGGDLTIRIDSMNDFSEWTVLLMIFQ